MSGQPVTEQISEEVMAPRARSEPVTSDEAASRPPPAIPPLDQVAPPMLRRISDQALWARVLRHARCADSGLNPDQWFPVSEEPVAARQEAAAAIAVCGACPVRSQCLALSLRYWNLGRHGVWGGLVAADRARLRRRQPADSTAANRSTAVPNIGTTVMLRVQWRPLKGWDVR